MQILEKTLSSTFVILQTLCERIAGCVEKQMTCSLFHNVLCYEAEQQM